MTRERLGPWLKLYADVTDRKAHYTDRQFRTLIEIFVHGLRGNPRGTLPSRAALAARYGVDEIDFLFDQGDIHIVDGTVSIVGWNSYQAHVLSTSRVQKVRGNAVETSSPRSETVTSRFAATSTSTSIDSENGERKNGASDSLATSYPSGDRDALDAFYELTRIRPWGRRPGEWLGELQEAHGVPNVIAALEVESRSGSAKDLISRVAARLEAQKHRVEKAAAKERRSAPKTGLQAEIAAAVAARYGDDDVTVEPDEEAGRKLREKLNGGGATGLASAVAGVVRSVPGAPETGLSLTAGEGSDTESAAVGAPAPQNGIRSPSPAGNGARLVDPYRTGRTNDRSAPSKPA